MRKFLFLFLVLMICCKSKNDDIKPQLRDVIISYQKKYPIPNPIETKSGIYVYSVVFKKEGEDTLISITRSSSGVLPQSKGFGIYEDGELSPSFIYDENKLSNNFISKKENFVDSKYLIHSNSFKESYPPIYTYLVRNEKFSLIKIDTIWSRWD